jgi:hypothetical protein
MPDQTLQRWDDNRREQLGGSIILLFGLSSASLAFCGSLLTEASVALGGLRTTLFLVASSFFILALVASVAVTVTRLQDARGTATIVRKRDDPTSTAEVQQLRDSTRRLGRWTWRLFYVQLFAFLFGAVFLLIALWLIFHTKLFP